MSCFDCKYKGTIPGNAHISCKLNWSKVEFKPPKYDHHGSKWYNFPFNFDPHWQIEKCHFSDKELDVNLLLKEDNFFNLISLLTR